MCWVSRKNLFWPHASRSQCTNMSSLCSAGVVEVWSWWLRCCWGVILVVLLVVEVLLTLVVLVAWWQLLLPSYYAYSLVRVVYMCGIRKTTQSFVTFPAWRKVKVDKCPKRQSFVTFADLTSSPDLKISKHGHPASRPSTQVFSWE